jgi:hypothetical protein
MSSGPLQVPLPLFTAGMMNEVEYVNGVNRWRQRYDFDAADTVHLRGCVGLLADCFLESEAEALDL